MLEECRGRGRWGVDVYLYMYTTTLLFIAISNIPSPVNLASRMCKAGGWQENNKIS
jgi:hypothetical protein